MNLSAIVLIALLGGFSFAIAQSSGRGISILPPTPKTDPVSPATTGANTGSKHSNDKSILNALSKAAGHPATKSVRSNKPDLRSQTTWHEILLWHTPGRVVP